MHSKRQLELVRALAEHRNFGHAANALGVSQPSLTRSLKHLEDRLGVLKWPRAAGPILAAVKLEGRLLVVLYQAAKGSFCC